MPLLLEYTGIKDKNKEHILYLSFEFAPVTWDSFPADCNVGCIPRFLLGPIGFSASSLILAFVAKYMHQNGLL